MEDLMTHAGFAQTFQKLAAVSLNPRRHTAADALAHSEAVAAQAVALARENGCSEAETRLLGNLGRAHDIGKITGTARPERSLEVLRELGVTDAAFLALVKWHDTSLPWYVGKSRGQAPSDKAWRRLAAEVDLRLLVIFMVADRVDAPPGWRRNAPTVWFHAEARARGLLGDLVLDVPGHPGEVSAGAAVVQGREVLVIRVRREGWELPKGGIEWDELPEEAALRETREEAGIASALAVEHELGHLDYAVREDQLKRVRYFRASAEAPIVLGPLPERTRERRWAGTAEIEALPLVNEGLRAMLLEAVG